MPWGPCRIRLISNHVYIIYLNRLFVMKKNSKLPNEPRKPLSSEEEEIVTSGCAASFVVLLMLTLILSAIVLIIRLFI